MLGAIVAVVAIAALRESKGRVTSATGTRETTIVQTVTSTPTPSTHGRASSTPRRSSAPSSAASTATSSTSTAASGDKAVPLIVLNSSGVPKLASTAEQRFRAGGWTVTRIDNLVNNIISTCAYYDPNVSGAKAAAEALRQQFPDIKRVKARFAQLPLGPIVVVLTRDYPSG